MTGRSSWLAVVAVIGLLTVACSGSSAHGGSGGSPAAGGSASSPAAGRPATRQKQLAFSECMRSHGVPNVPTSLPTLSSGTPSSSGPHKWVPASGPGATRLQAATQACRYLLGESRAAG